MKPGLWVLWMGRPSIKGSYPRQAHSTPVVLQFEIFPL
jgi:hypothetical protein